MASPHGGASEKKGASKMSKLSAFILPLSFLLVMTTGQEDELAKRARTVFKPIPTTPPALADNPLTSEEVDLGKALYFDPRLSASWLISCNTCHNLGLAGVDLEETSIGHGWQKGPRNAPTVLNAVFNVAQFWDGRAADLEEQAMGPVQAAVEMSSDRGRAEATLRSIPGYVRMFEAAFPDQAEPVTFENMAKAIEAFEATLLTPDSPFDRFLKGEGAALDETQRAGLTLFMDRGCAACHGGLNVGGTSYHPFGVVEKPGADILPPEDKGRFQVTKTASDEYVFKAPSLRNVDRTPPYFHSGRVWGLEQAVAIMGSAQLGATLSDEETRAIAAFLATLTGEQPQVEYPILPPHTDRTPLPIVNPEGLSAEEP
jgi:cytochrome c peroxidase